jgi:hypothetical protein
LVESLPGALAAEFMRGAQSTLDKVSEQAAGGTVSALRR